MKRGRYAVTKDGDGRKVTSVSLPYAVWELATLAGLNVSRLTENAILREFGIEFDKAEGERDEHLQARVREVLDEHLLKAETRDKRIELLKQEVEFARARAIAEEMTAQAVEAADREREEAHKRSLEAAWARVAEKQYLTPEKVGKWLPMVDTAGDYVDEWEALPVWLSREAGESFTADEVLTYAKRYAAGDSPPPDPPREAVRSKRPGKRSP